MLKPLLKHPHFRFQRAASPKSPEHREPVPAQNREDNLERLAGQVNRRAEDLDTLPDNSLTLLSSWSFVVAFFWELLHKTLKQHFCVLCWSSVICCRIFVSPLLALKGNLSLLVEHVCFFFLKNTLNLSKLKFAESSRRGHAPSRRHPLGVRLPSAGRLGAS